MTEQIPNQENKRDLVARALKSLGFEDADARRILVEWTQEQEHKVESLGTREAQLDFELDRAQLYFDAGLKDQAIQTLSDASDIAFQEKMYSYMDKIAEKFQEYR